MNKYERVFIELPYNQAADFVSEHFDDLEDLYYSIDAPNGTAGKVWRNIWGKPRNLTPLAFYLGFKLRQLHDEQDELVKKTRKKTRENERKKLTKYIESLSNENSYLAQELEQTAEEKLEIEEQLQEQLRYKAQIESRLNPTNKPIKHSQSIELIDALIDDVRMLVERLRRHELIKFEDLCSYTLTNKDKKKSDDDDV